MEGQVRAPSFKCWWPVPIMVQASSPIKVTYDRADQWVELERGSDATAGRGVWERPLAHSGSVILLGGSVLQFPHADYGRSSTRQ
jgi:hypothetical protein